jgi:hypothetical protein
MTQGPYQNTFGYSRDAAFAGLVESAERVISRINSTRKLYQVVLGAHADGIYKIFIDGVEKATFTASTSSLADIRDNLLADLVADGTMHAEASSTDTILIEKEEYDDGDPVVTTSTTGSTFVTTLLVPQGQEIPFGCGVVMDPRASASGRQCRLPRLTGEISAPTFLGIAAADTSRAKNAGGWPTRSSVSILRRGAIWCRSETAIVEGSNPYCRFAAGGQLGIFGNTAGSSEAVQPKGLIAITGVSAAGIFLAEFSPQT